MIPESYGRILRRWFWLIAIFGVLGGALTYFYVVSTSFGQGSSYHSSTTLGVSRVVNYNGSVVSGSTTSIDADIINARANAITDWTRTPQFLVLLEGAMRQQGSNLTQAGIFNRVLVRSDRAPGLVVISADGRSLQEAKVLAESAARLIQERVRNEEQQVINALQTNFQLSEDDLRRRLRDVYGLVLARADQVEEPALREAMAALVARGETGTPPEEFSLILEDLAAAAADPELIVLRAQVGAIEANLSEVSTARENLAADLKLWEQPLVIVYPAETVESETLSRLRKRDLVAVGGLGGLVVGWLVAGVAERAVQARAASRREREAASPSGVRGTA